MEWCRRRECLWCFSFHLYHDVETIFHACVYAYLTVTMFHITLVDDYIFLRKDMVSLSTRVDRLIESVPLIEWPTLAVVVVLLF